MVYTKYISIYFSKRSKKNANKIQQSMPGNLLMIYAVISQVAQIILKSLVLDKNEPIGH